MGPAGNEAPSSRLQMVRGVGVRFSGEGRAERKLRLTSCLVCLADGGALR